MAEPFTAPPAGPHDDAALDDTALRGELVIKERAVVKIAVAAALQVPGVVKQSGGLSRLTGRELPRADVSTGAGAVAINLYIAVQWPCHLDLVNRRLRAQVHRQVEQMTGMPVIELNIVVVGTESAAPEDSSTESRYSEQGDPAVPPAPVAPIRPRTPRATPAAVPAAIIVAVGALGLAVVAARELLIMRGTFANAPWIRNTVQWLGRLHWSEWIVPAAAGAIVLGVVFIVAALKPRPRTHLPLAVGDTPIVWLRPTDLARNSSSHAKTVPGVLSAHTTVDRKHVTVRVVRTESTPASDVAISVREAVEPTLSLLGTSPELRVQVKP
ncbi:putative alkaline shock family protein YloU [Rhodococcus percolatus]|uniref:DUF6286 domain-containing protein n=1 Tax=Rhodococcus opacus TaxID=37919 RepID=UPI0015F7F2CE|nr:DUF6286 domain-containing Asp23/Gls24 family envelope stress response protein [Rhodococcus opacus]MBA8962740.1 putative alkaline shock family protein YloU [Rhodococcus opacus]MBP2208731.1 putative alkaline shock family protein YloU [Rhodococcus opacus]